MTRFLVKITVVCALMVSPALAKTSAQSGEIRARVAHLLQRASFGPLPGQIDALAKSGEAGLQSWLDEQLNPSNTLDVDVAAKLKKFPSLSMSNSEIEKAYPKKNKEKKNNAKDVEDGPKQILFELAAQKLIRATESKKQLQEVLSDFWFNHFNVDYRKGATKWLITSYERDVIRPNVYGKFVDLLKAVAHSPAMLVYLDNHQSVKPGFMPANSKKKNKNPTPKGINENYARELMELHTLGVNGGYAQRDVIQVAKILTGWTINREEGTFAFRARAHDVTSKKVMGVTFPAGHWEDEGNRLLEFLAKQPATAKFISKKIAIHFVSDTPPDSLIEKLSKVYLSTDGNLTSMYRELFRSPEFWSNEARRSKIKRPFHLIASIGRSLNAKVDVTLPRDLKKIDQILGQMGEPIYRCQPPTGFKDTAAFWVNPGALVVRINTALAITGERIPSISFEPSMFRNELHARNVSTDNQAALSMLDQWMLGDLLSIETKNKIAKELNEEPKVLDEIDARKKEVVDSSVNVTKLLGLLLGSPEYQRY